MRHDITARFRAVVARADERIAREDAERLAMIRALPIKREAGGHRSPRAGFPKHRSGKVAPHGRR